METQHDQQDTQAYADMLRAAADLIDAHPELPLPVVFGYASVSKIQVTWQLMNTKSTKDQQRKAAATIARTIGGHWTKDGSSEMFTLAQQRDRLELQILATRDQVCERVVVGTEPVTIPAVEAQPERVEDHEIVEWRCESLLADRQDEAKSA